MFNTFKKTKKLFRQTARLMIGIPDYDTYVGHMKTIHPDRAPMTYKEFFKERQDSRYGKGRPGCC